MKAKPKNKKDEERCPSCGYCPHCGRSDEPQRMWWYQPYLPPPAPYVPPTRPWPYWSTTWPDAVPYPLGSGTTTVTNVDSTVPYNYTGSTPSLAS